jgi:hypothetical protein
VHKSKQSTIGTFEMKFVPYTLVWVDFGLDGYGSSVLESTPNLTSSQLTLKTPYAPTTHNGPRKLAPGTAGAPGNGDPTTPRCPGILTGPRSRQVDTNPLKLFPSSLFFLAKIFLFFFRRRFSTSSGIMFFGRG